VAYQAIFDREAWQQARSGRQSSGISLLATSAHG
jgi:hypothetical protein